MRRQPTEAALTRTVMRWLRARPGAWTVKVSQRFMAGVPDIFHAEGGRCWFVELKRPGNRPTHLQTITMDRIRAAGIPAFWATSADTVRDVILGRLDPFALPTG